MSFGTHSLQQPCPADSDGQTSQSGTSAWAGTTLFKRPFSARIPLREQKLPDFSSDEILSDKAAPFLSVWDISDVYVPYAEGGSELLGPLSQKPLRVEQEPV